MSDLKRQRADNDYPIVEIRRLDNKDAHLETLRRAFKEARKTILITSYAIQQDTIDMAELVPLIQAACKRGVKIYFYYNDIKILTKKLTQQLIELGVHVAETYTHSKILAVDHSWVALGSFNWLSDVNSRYSYSENASIICKGEICPDLIEDLWDHLKHYRHLQFDMFKKVEIFEDENDNSIVYDIAPGDELSYLPTLDEHLGFFQSVFEDAKSRIVICSPFISSTASYKEDLDPQILREATQRGVKIIFLCSGKDPALPDFNAFINSMKLKNIYVVPMANIHLKTIVIDDNLIAEGSFNWLSAARDQDSDYHNHEATLIVQGNIAKPLISSFFTTEVGRIVLQQINSISSAPGNLTTLSSSHLSSNPASSVAEDLLWLQSLTKEELDEYFPNNAPLNTTDVNSEQEKQSQKNAESSNLKINVKNDKM